MGYGNAVTEGTYFNAVGACERLEDRTEQRTVRDLLGATRADGKATLSYEHFGRPHCSTFSVHETTNKRRAKNHVHIT